MGHPTNATSATKASQPYYPMPAGETFRSHHLSMTGLCDLPLHLGLDFREVQMTLFMSDPEIRRTLTFSLMQVVPHLFLQWAQEPCSSRGNTIDRDRAIAPCPPLPALSLKDGSLNTPAFEHTAVRSGYKLILSADSSAWTTRLDIGSGCLIRWQRTSAPMPVRVCACFRRPT